MKIVILSTACVRAASSLFTCRHFMSGAGSKNSNDNVQHSNIGKQEEEGGNWGLTSALDSITTTTPFAVGGRLANFVELNMHVDGLGAVEWPLGGSQVTELLRCCDPAPFCRGLDTVVDTSVRRVLQIDASRVKMGSEWDAEIQRLALVTAEQLGAVSGATRCVKANLYKLVYYKEGVFFKPHKDTEKEPGMFATLVVQLPVEGGHTGGSLFMRHAGEEKTFKWDEDSHVGRFYSAFFTDCEQELQEVKAGHRVCLVYNLLSTGPDQSSLISMRGVLSGRDKVVDQIREAVVRWETAAAADSSEVEKIIIPLEHEYTAPNLSFPGLKGRDAAMVARLRAGNCVVHLAHVLKSKSQMSQNFRDGCGRQAFCASETQESVDVDMWVGEDGRDTKVSLLVDLETELLAGSKDPFRDREPDDDMFSVFTRSEVATLALWYRVGFAVVWPRSRAVSMACKGRLELAVELAQTAVSSGGPEAETTLGEVVNFACSAVRAPRGFALKASELGPVLGKLLSFTVAMPAVQMCLKLLDVLETAASLSHCPWEAWRGIAAAMAAWGDQEDGRVKVAVERVIRALCRVGEGQGKGVEVCVKIVGLLQEEGKLELGVTVARAVATVIGGGVYRGNVAKDYGVMLFRMEGCHAELNAALTVFCARAADLGREVISDLVVSVYEELGAPALGAEGGMREGMVSLAGAYATAEPPPPPSIFEPGYWLHKLNEQPSPHPFILWSQTSKLLSLGVELKSVEMGLVLLDVLRKFATKHGVKALTAPEGELKPIDAWRGMFAVMEAWGDQEDGRVKVAVEGVIRALCKDGGDKGTEACVKIVRLLQEEGKSELGVTMARAVAMASLRCNGGKDYGLLLFRMEGCHAELSAALVTFCARAAVLGREVISDLVVSVYEELGAPALGAEGCKREAVVNLVEVYVTGNSARSSSYYWSQASKLLSIGVEMQSMKMGLAILGLLKKLTKAGIAALTAPEGGSRPVDAWRGIAAAMEAWGGQEDGRVRVAVERVIWALVKVGEGVGLGACVKVVGFLQEEGKLELGVTVARAIATGIMGGYQKGRMSHLQKVAGREYGVMLFRMEGCHAELNAALTVFCAHAADLGREVISDVVVRVYKKLGAPALQAEGGKLEAVVSLVAAYTSVMFTTTGPPPPSSSANDAIYRHKQAVRQANASTAPPDWRHASNLLSLLLLHNERLLLDLFVAAFVGGGSSDTSASQLACLKHLLAHPPVKAACQAGDVAVVRLAETLMAHLRRPKPELNWRQPNVVSYISYPDIVAFLRGPEMQTCVGGFTGIQKARDYASNLLMYYRRDVTCVARGIRSHAHVCITKRNESYENRLRLWEAQQRELKALRRLIGGVSGKPDGDGAVASAAVVANVGGVLHESNGDVKPPPLKKPRVKAEI